MLRMSLLPSSASAVFFLTDTENTVEQNFTVLDEEGVRNGTLLGAAFAKRTRNPYILSHPMNKPRGSARFRAGVSGFIVTSC